MLRSTVRSGFPVHDSVHGHRQPLGNRMLLGWIPVAHDLGNRPAGPPTFKGLWQAPGPCAEQRMRTRLPNRPPVTCAGQPGQGRADQPPMASLPLSQALTSSARTRPLTGWSGQVFSSAAASRSRVTVIVSWLRLARSFVPVIAGDIHVMRVPRWSSHSSVTRHPLSVAANS
jgi:hypothetical protein